MRRRNALPTHSDEVEHLHGVSTRLEGLADEHPLATEELLTIAGNVRSVATLLAVLVATKLHGGDGHRSSDQRELAVRHNLVRH